MYLQIAEERNRKRVKKKSNESQESYVWWGHTSTTISCNLRCEDCHYEQMTLVTMFRNWFGLVSSSLPQISFDGSVIIFNLASLFVSVQFS